MAHLRIIGFAESSGDLRVAYQEFAARPLPEVYRPRHGDAPGIVRAHSLDPVTMRLAFRTTAAVNRGGSLSWARRELVNTTVSRRNQCFY